MKRCWIGVGLLAVLLGLGIFSTWKMQAIHDPMSQEITRAAAQAELGNWAEAEALASQAKSQWEDNWGFSASMADHEPMEQINGLFAQLEVSLGARDALSFRLLCGELSQELEAMGEAHKFIWWNLL